MNEQIPKRPEPRFTLSTVGWYLVGIALIAVFLLLPVYNARDEHVFDIAIETDAIRTGLIQYKTEFGAFPSGDSRAICRALSGQNLKGIRFVDLHSVTPDGNFLDQWDTPYKIYCFSDEPLVRSAGPNKQFDRSTDRKQSDDYFNG